MDSGIVSDYGLDFDIYTSKNAGDGTTARIMVYPGRRIIVFTWRNILSVASYEIFSCYLAFVRNRRKCVILFRSIVWIDIRFLNLQKQQSCFCHSGKGRNDKARQSFV